MTIQSSKQDDQVDVAILFFVGDHGAGDAGTDPCTGAVVTIVIGIIVALGHAGGVVVAASGAGFGILLIGPVRDMAEVYRINLLDGFRWDTDSLDAYSSEMLGYWLSWKYFTPLDIFAIGAAFAVRQVHGESPRRQTVRGKPVRIERQSLMARWAERRQPKQSPVVEGGTLLSVEKTSGQKVHLNDADAHTFLLGTSGSDMMVAVRQLADDELFTPPTYVKTSFDSSH